MVGAVAVCSTVGICPTNSQSFVTFQDFIMEQQGYTKKEVLVSVFFLWVGGQKGMFFGWKSACQKRCMGIVFSLSFFYNRLVLAMFDEVEKSKPN